MNDKIIERLKRLRFNKGLRFLRIDTNKKDKILVFYEGYSGYRGEILDEKYYARKYKDDLQWETNREVKFTTYDNNQGMSGKGGFYFEVYPNKIFKKSIENREDKISRINGGCYNINDGGQNFAIIYTLHTAYLKNKIPKNCGITIKNNSLYIDNIKVANILEFKEEYRQGTNQPNYICATYETLVDNLNELYMKKQKDITNIILKDCSIKCTEVENYYSEQFNSSGIRIIFDNFKPFCMRNYYFFDEKDLNDMRKVEE